MTPERIAILREANAKAKSSHKRFVELPCLDVDDLLAEAEAAERNYRTSRIALVVRQQLDTWLWNLEHNKSLEPKRDDQIRMLKGMVQQMTVFTPPAESEKGERE